MKPLGSLSVWGHINGALSALSRFINRSQKANWSKLLSISIWQGQSAVCPTFSFIQTTSEKAASCTEGGASLCFSFFCSFLVFIVVHGIRNTEGIGD